MTRMIGRVAESPRVLGGLTRVYIQTDAEAMGGLHEVLTEGVVAELCLKQAKVGSWMQLQGDLRSNAEQREDGSWRWRSAIVADRVKVFSEYTGQPFNEVLTCGYVCTPIEIHRPFSNQLHPLWMDAVETSYIEIDRPGGEEYTLVALSEHMSGKIKNGFILNSPVVIRGNIVSGTIRDTSGRSWRISAVNARSFERKNGFRCFSALGPEIGPGCTAAEIELLWAASPCGPEQKRQAS